MEFVSAGRAISSIVSGACQRESLAEKENSGTHRNVNENGNADLTRRNTARRVASARVFRAPSFYVSRNAQSYRAYSVHTRANDCRIVNSFHLISLSRYFALLNQECTCIRTKGIFAYKEDIEARVGKRPQYNSRMILRI